MTACGSCLWSRSRDFGAVWHHAMGGSTEAQNNLAVMQHSGAKLCGQVQSYVETTPLRRVRANSQVTMPYLTPAPMLDRQNLA